MSIRAQSSLRLFLLSAVLGFAVAPLAAQNQLVDFSGISVDADSYYQLPSAGTSVLTTGGVQLPHETPSWGGFSDFTISSRTDNTTAGFSNPASAFPGTGDGDSQYAVGYGNGLRLGFSAAGGVNPASVSLTNTTYAALSMRDGDDFAKQFGGPTGTDPDYFLLTLTGFDSADNSTGSVDFYLADFRFADSGDDYIVDSWTEVDLTALGTGVAAIEFTYESSDVGQFGINTPQYFAMDNLAYAPVPEPLTTTVWLSLATAAILLRRRRRSA